MTNSINGDAQFGRRLGTDADRKVWAEDDRDRGGPLIIPDIRNPKVCREVKQIARQQEARLDATLFAAGLHVTQRDGAVA